MFLGRPCAFSRLAFEPLVAANLPIVGVIIPAAAGAGPEPRRVAAAGRSALPMAPTDLVGLAHALGIPVFAVRALRAPASLALLAQLRPTVLGAACFPRRLPAEWLAAAPRGALNIHPSRLPAYRGPEPLFWQLRQAEPHPGVTVHQMDADFDTGPILAQHAIPWPAGASEAELERLTAAAGGRLLAELLTAGRFAAQPQPAADASYYPRPTAVDLVIPTTWPARRAFNFMRGAAGWGPFVIEAPDGRRWPAAAALALTEAVQPPAAVGHWIPFSPGFLLVRP